MYSQEKPVHLLDDTHSITTSVVHHQQVMIYSRYGELEIDTHSEHYSENRPRPEFLTADSTTHMKVD
jgi:hypothetical protein